MSGVPPHADSAVQQVLLGDAAEHAKVGLFVWNEELRYIAVNEEAARLAGTTREDLLGSVVGSHNPVTGAAVIASIRERTPARGRWTTPDGLQLEYLVVATRAAGLPYFFGVLWPAD